MTIEGTAIAKGRGHRAEGRREKIDLSWFQDWARVLIALATAITAFFDVGLMRSVAQK